MSHLIMISGGEESVMTSLSENVTEVIVWPDNTVEVAGYINTYLTENRLHSTFQRIISSPNGYATVTLNNGRKIGFSTSESYIEAALAQDIPITYITEEGVNV